MSVQLTKVTLFVVDSDSFGGLNRLLGDCSHNPGVCLAVGQTVQFDREWSDDDPLNQTTTRRDRALLEGMVDGASEKRLIW